MAQDGVHEQCPGRSPSDRSLWLKLRTNQNQIKTLQASKSVSEYIFRAIQKNRPSLKSLRIPFDGLFGGHKSIAQKGNVANIKAVSLTLLRDIAVDQTNSGRALHFLECMSKAVKNCCDDLPSGRPWYAIRRSTTVLPETR
jgi:hypothetical protein